MTHDVLPSIIPMPRSSVTGLAVGVSVALLLAAPYGQPWDAVVTTVAYYAFTRVFADVVRASDGVLELTHALCDMDRGAARLWRRSMPWSRAE